MAEAVLATPAKKWAREYELIYILRPNVDPDDAAKVAQRIQEVMERMNGKITKVDLWGKRKLAYSIQKHTRGIFVFVKFAAFGDIVAELERNLRLLEPVIRYQTIVVNDRIDLESVEVDAEETAFAAIEQTEDEEAELTTAQRLGMEDVRPKAPPAEAKAEGEEAKAEGEEAKAEGEEAKAEGEEAKAEGEGEAVEAAEAEGEAKAEGEAPAEAASDDSEASSEEE